MSLINLNFTQEQLGVIDKALQQIPFYLAAPLIQEINKQIQRHFDNAADRKDEG